MRQWLAAALVAAVAACAGPSARPTLGADPQPDAPLAARVFPPHYGSVPFQLSKPAYVALFEIVPGRGAALLYPQSGVGYQQATENWVPMRYSASRWLYRTDAPGRYGYQSAAFSSGYDQYRGVDPSGFARPRYLVLVASEEPLAVEQFQDDPASLVRYLGVAHYASNDPYDVMERLAYAVLPFAPADGWAMDVYVDWGGYDWSGFGPGMTAAQASYWPVVCANGAVQYMRYVSGWGFSTPPCLGASIVPPGTVIPPGVPVDTLRPPVPAGEGRDRSGAPDERGRSRAGTSATMEYVDPDGARVRGRSATSLEAAGRAALDADVTDRLRRDVRQRQRAARALGLSQPQHLAGSEAPRLSPDDAAGRVRAERRGRAGRPAYEGAELGRSTQALPRARGGAAARDASAASEGARIRREAQSQAQAERAQADRERSSSGSSSSGSSSSGSSSGSSGGRSRTTPPPR